MVKFYSGLLFIFAFAFLPSSARAVCTLPAGDHGDMLYNLDHTVMQYCNGTKWISMDASKSGGADNLGNHTATKDLDMTGHKIVNAAIPTSSADATNKAYVDAAVASAASSGQQSTAPTTCYYTNAMCGQAFTQMDGNFYSGNGTSHTICCASPSETDGGKDADGTTSGYGYIVLSQSTWNGNLGGLEGANAKCKSELQTKNWKGKSDVVSFDNARALLCDSTTCGSLQAYKIYAYARAGSATDGGLEIGTNGPGSYIDLMQSKLLGSATYYGNIMRTASVFGTSGTYDWWTNIKQHGSYYARMTLKAVPLLSSPIENCNKWRSSSNTYTAPYGISYFENSDERTFSLPVYHKTATCNSSKGLLCIVD